MRANPVLDALGAYGIAELQEKARAMAAAGQPVIDFSIGDPREATPPFIRETVRDAIPDVSQYPTVPGLAQFREAVANYLMRRFGVEVDPGSQVLPTTGSKEAIFSTAMAFVDASAGDVVVWASPGYPIYERGARLAGAETHVARLTGDFVLRPDDVPDHVWERARILWVNYPHNPTGAIATGAQLEAVYEATRVTGTLLCADECYVDLYEGGPPPGILEVAESGCRGVLCYLSLSKRSGMTGYRSGAIVGDAEAIEALRRLRTSTGTQPQEFIQIGAAAAWADDHHVAERRKIFADKRGVLRAAFDEIGLEVVGSRAAIYLWVEVEDDVAAAERLLSRGVVVSPGRVFGPGGEGYLRLALVPTVEECEAAVEVLQECLTGS
jgi:succinyldiaminopimelate transaminase